MTMTSPRPSPPSPLRNLLLAPNKAKSSVPRKSSPSKAAVVSSKRSRQRQQVNPAPAPTHSDSPADVAYDAAGAEAPTTARPSAASGVPPAPRSAPPSGAVPLPKSHIRRTPSELLLLDETRRYEVDDVRMYARLVVGMQNQIQRDLRWGHGNHPKTTKSLQGVVRTKKADDRELWGAAANSADPMHTTMDGIEETSSPFAHLVEGSASSDETVDSSSWSTRATTSPRAGRPSKSESDGSLSTRGSFGGGAEFEGRDNVHDCVFNLDL
ncbi:hypothetical protein ACHAWF_001636 [Thalassiosira exigua]